MRRTLLLVGVAAFVASMPGLAGGQGRSGDRGREASAPDRSPRAGRGHGNGRQAERRAGPSRGRDDARPLDHRERRVEQALRQERREVDRARAQQASRRQRMAEAPEPRKVRPARLDRRDWRAWSGRPPRPDDRLRTWAVPYRPFPETRAAAARSSCPPGLARQNRFCLPPGQLRRARFIGRPLPIAARPYNVPARYAYRFVDGERLFYRYDAGSVFAFDRATGLVSRVVPLLSTGLFPGEPLPIGYDAYNLPIAYRPAYADTDEWIYRYDGDAIYRVDAESRLVDGIVALLTGSGGLGGLGVGDPLPAGYDVYNLPVDYRSTYVDRDDALFRYADGWIYQVDPRTRRVEAVISTLA